MLSLSLSQLIHAKWCVNNENENPPYSLYLSNSLMQTDWESHFSGFTGTHLSVGLPLHCRCLEPVLQPLAWTSYWIWKSAEHTIMRSVKQGEKST